MQQNGIEMKMLEELFHFDSGKVDVIASVVPGKNKTQQTINAYVIQGLANFLATGSAAFDDKSARALCKNLGCIDEPNHKAIVRKIGNKITGSKETGWTLTAPGLAHGGTIVKDAVKKK
jgi:hypothetical protein